MKHHTPRIIRDVFTKQLEENAELQALTDKLCTTLNENIDTLADDGKEDQ